MKKLFTLIVLALAFGACQTAPKADPTMLEQLQGSWAGNQIMTFTGDKVEETLINGRLFTTRWFETHIQDKDGRSWAVFTNTLYGGPDIGFYTSNNQLGFISDTKVNIPIKTGSITYQYTKQ